MRHQKLPKPGRHIYVDRNNDGQVSLKRYKKKSFYWYKDVIATNGAILGGVGER